MNYYETMERNWEGKAYHNLGHVAVATPGNIMRAALLFDHLIEYHRVDKHGEDPTHVLPPSMRLGLTFVDEPPRKPVPLTIEDHQAVWLWYCNVAARVGTYLVPVTDGQADYGKILLPPGKHVTFAGAFENLPVVNDAQVTIEQILEFRKDTDAIRKYRDLQLWLRSSLKAESVAHAKDLIVQKIDNYEWALHKHGLETKRGLITFLIDRRSLISDTVAAGTGAVFGGPIAAALLTGVVVIGQVSAFLLERRIAYEEILHGEHSAVAILYDLQQRFGQHGD